MKFSAWLLTAGYFEEAGFVCTVYLIVILIRRWLESEVCIVHISQQGNKRHGLINHSSILPMIVVAFVMNDVKIVTRNLI